MKACSRSWKSEHRTGFRNSTIADQALRVAKSYLAPTWNRESRLIHEDHKLCVIVRMQLSHGPVDVGFGRRRTDHETFCGFVIRQSETDESRDLAFACGELAKNCRSISDRSRDKLSGS